MQRHKKHLLQMHKPAAIAVALATVCAVPVSAEALDTFQFLERPVIEVLDMNPSFTNLFKPIDVGFSQSVSTVDLKFTGISSSSNTFIAHLEHMDSHSYAKIGDLLPDGSRLVHVDITLGTITTSKNNTFSTFALPKYD